MNLSLYNNVFLSTYGKIKTLLEDNNLIISGSSRGVTLLQSYPDDDQLKTIVFRADYDGSSKKIPLPVIAIEQSNVINNRAFELGTLVNEKTFPFSVTVFAETHLQRNQFLGFFDENLLDASFDYCDYDVNFETPPVSGTLYISSYRSFPVRFIDTPNKVLKYGADIFFEVSVLS